MKHKDEFAGKKIAFDQHSILTGRDFDEIATGDKVWHSNRSVKENLKPLAKPATPKNRKPTSRRSIFGRRSIGSQKNKNLSRQLAAATRTLADEAFDNDEWLFETKYDGYRALGTN
jgi:bifunctional non-homologous end joining protein LigD